MRTAINILLVSATLAAAAGCLSMKLADGLPPAQQQELEVQLKSQNLVWNSPSLASRDSMPIGNGDIGINVWNDPNGDLMLYIGKTDAFDESCRLLKVGRLRVSFPNHPFGAGQSFRQELDLAKGEIRIDAGKGTNAVSLRIWVDANHPVIHLESSAASPIKPSVKLELWRTEKKPIQGHQSEHHALDGMAAGEAPMQFPDVIMDTTKVPGLVNRLVWYHRNAVSIHPVILKLQELDPAQCAPDPLLKRTFGCAVMADGWVTSDTATLRAATPEAKSHLMICALTEQTPDAEAWLKDLAVLASATQKSRLERCRSAHQQWWEHFWARSWVRVSGGNTNETANITRGWHLNRFLTACTARGNAPVKFNGAIFNVDGVDANGSVVPAIGPDARMWGPGFWFQNERHIYWPMMQAGDYEQFLPFFKMYRDALPLAKARTQAYFKHDGVFFPETMYLWGTYLANDCGYGWDRRNKELGLTDNQYIRRYWQGGIELSAMMLEYYQHTRDKAFARDTLLPIASQIVTFYDQHYKRDEQGKIHFEPAQMLETMWNVVNPMPEIAGLNCVIDGLLGLPDGLSTPAERQQWKRVLSELPPLPMAKVGDTPILGLAEVNRSSARNMENGHLYAVWPYKRLGVAVGNLKLAQDSYAHRWHKGGPYQCWMNDEIFAAYCGLAREATDHLAYRFVRTDGLRFPAMYTHGDWVPDLDNGGVCQNTIQSMLMQYNGKRIVLLPAWPKEWNASFKLHAPENTTIEGRVENGSIQDLKVSPESRRCDIEIRPAQ